MSPSQRSTFDEEPSKKTRNRVWSGDLQSPRCGSVTAPGRPYTLPLLCSGGACGRLSLIRGEYVLLEASRYLPVHVIGETMAGDFS